MDWLSSDNVRAYVIGATNALFKQRKELFDAIVVIDEDGPHIEIIDPELKRIVALTTADLRFCDYIVRHVVQTGNVLVDTTMWEGGDEWIRLQFRAYLLSLLATAQTGDPTKEEDFSRAFIRSWKSTHNYRVWVCGKHGDAVNGAAGHPFQGQVNLADMKLRLTHTMQNTDQGRKISQAASQTGRYVAQTGRAVGGALKSVVGQFWSGLHEPR